MKSKGTVRLGGTLLDRLVQSLDQAARHSPAEAVAPAAVLWTDADGQWKPLADPLRARMPHFLALGSYEPEKRTGPAIWIKCAIAGKIGNLGIVESTVPIVYLPGVSRQVLRAGEDCPLALQPLVELLYRGAVWMQRNGKDWTVEAFLSSDEGLGLDLAKDAATRDALRRALPDLAATAVSRLTGRRLEAEDFDRLIVPDLARDLLGWMSDPAGTRAKWDESRWRAFGSQCKAAYKFDPEKDGEVVAGEKLGMRESEAWKALWGRYAEAPDLFPGIPALLDRCRPTSVLLLDGSPWPGENRKAEDDLRRALVALGKLDPVKAREEIARLAGENGPRRDWVWAKLGQSPLAGAMKHLEILAARTASVPGGETPDKMADRYEEGAFAADGAALDAVASVKTEADRKAVGIAVRAAYLPWLDDAARQFQELVTRHALPSKGQVPAVEAEPGECIFFADGLRYDLAQRLAERLEERGLKASRHRRWAGLPSVTPTAKPAASPLRDRLGGDAIPEDFTPKVAGAGQALTADRFRKLLAENGYQVIPAGESGHPEAQDARGWTESGQIDKSGHDQGIRLTGELNAELDRFCERIGGLLEAGWKSVRVVTDHGWLLVPGGLPKHDLPAYLVESRWARCAAIKGNSRVSVPTARWHWNPDLEFATAPGAGCFAAGMEYAHGGLSLQECLLSDLVVTSGEAAAVPRIKEIQWSRLRCRIRLDLSDPGFKVDIRAKAGDPASSLVESPKAADAEGRCSLGIRNEDLAGAGVVVVVLDGSGRVVAKESTIVGG